MMAKKANPLAAAVRSMVPEPAPKPAAPAPQPAKQTAAPRPLSRQGKTFIAVYVDPDAHKQLKVFAAMNERGIQDCMLEALDDFFDKQGLNRIAQPKDG